MTNHFEEARNIPIICEVDVLVAGAGPAGIGAAVRAAKMGAKTLVIEAQNCVGGTATAGLMSHWGGRSSSHVLKEIIDRSSKASMEDGVTIFHEDCPTEIDHEKLKLLLFEMLKEAGADIMLYTQACDAIVESGRVKGVIVENKSGRGAIYAKVVVDATGDGDIAARANVPFELGREDDKKMQPATLMFKVGGVDCDRAVFPESFETRVHTERGELQTLASALLPHPAGHVLLYRTTLPGVVCCNMTNSIGVDGTDAASLTEGTYICMTQLQKIVDFLREYVPGYEKCFLLTTAQTLGIRETRHFKGLKRLEAEDILSAKYHDDWAVQEAFFNFDVHNMTGSGLDETGVQEKWAQKNTYSIPYGCLVPAGIEGLLLSGRNISGSHLAHSNFRIMSVCMALGEAAGAAAAIGTRDGHKLSEILPTLIQEAVSQPI